MIPGIDNGKVPTLQAVTVADASYSSVSSLLHCDGVNASTSFPDSKGNTWTANGNAQLSTTSPKFGTASALFDGSGDYLQSTTTSMVGAADFTVEMWFKPANIANEMELLGISNGTGFSNYDFILEMTSTGAIRASVRNNGTVLCDFNTTVVMVAGTWKHVACVADGGTCRVYADGVQVGSAAISGTRGATQTVHRIGYLDGVVPRYLDGNLDDIRITRGVCRYPSGTTFTPPAAAFPSLDAKGTWTVDASSRVTVSAGTAADAQGCAADGIHVWFSKSDRIFKYTKAGTLVTSRVVSGDNPTSKNQINGLFHKDGTLYASAAEFTGGIGTSYIVEYDPDTLAYRSHRTLAGDHFSEGLAWKGGSWWVVFHANMEICRYDRSWAFVASYPLTYPITGSSGGYGAGTGYDGVVWQGNLIYCNIHEIYNEDFVDVYAWNGTGFTQVRRAPRPGSIMTQGFCKDPADGRLWFAERNYSGSDSFVAVTLS